MPYKTLIFDLDGTISNPKQGILRSINYALEHFSFATINDQQVEAFIGPPLDQTFYKLTQSSDQNLINSLVAKYRERYADIGYSENSLYDGISTVLKQFHQTQKCRLGLCTSKRVDFADQILDMFGLLDLFDFTNGGDIGIHKWQQLSQLLSDAVINKQSVMIGDRFVDLNAAHRNELDSAAVLWGYGSVEELQKENPRHLFKQTEQLIELI